MGHIFYTMTTYIYRERFESHKSDLWISIMVFHFREWVTYAHSQKVPIDEKILVWGGLWMAQIDKHSVRSSLVAIF